MSVLNIPLGQTIKLYSLTFSLLYLFFIPTQQQGIQQRSTESIQQRIVSIVCAPSCILVGKKVVVFFVEINNFMKRY